jgi:hypothetical protein
MNGFVLINQSSDPALTRENLDAFAAVLALQQAEIDDYYQGTAWQVVVADSEAAAPQGDGWILAKFLDALDDPEALAYHSTTPQGRPLILMGVGIVKANAPAGGDWVSGPDSLLTATSHEFGETRANPYCALYTPFDGSTWIPQEICDPVQGDSYEFGMHKGLFLSNFVGPRYWSDGVGPYDRMGLVTSPRQVRPGGYQQRLVGGPNGASTAVFGAHPHEGGMAEWKRIAKAKAGTRFAKIAAKADGTDELARARSSISELRTTLEEQRAHNDNLAIHLRESAGADAFRALEAELAGARTEIAKLRDHQCVNGGHGG